MVLAGKGIGQSGSEGTYLFLPLQYKEFGVEGTDLWLAASGDQRVSIWASDWLQGHCELVDWLSFPAPTLLEVRVLVAPWAGIVPAHLATACCTPQDPGCPPPSLAAFCPWDRALLVCTGLGPHPEVIFYSLRQKQACTRPCGAGRGRSWGHGSYHPVPHICCPQVVEKIPLPFFAISLSLSPGARLIAIGFTGEFWWMWTLACLEWGQVHLPVPHTEICHSALHPRFSCL